MLAMVSLALGSAQARGLEKATERVNAQGADKVEISVDFGAGELIVEVADIPEVAVLEVEYDPDQVDYEVTYRVRGSTGVLDLESLQRRKKDIDTDNNTWFLTLSDRYEARLTLDVGACDAEIDLGGMPLEELSIDIGAASGALQFSKPNPIRLEEIDIDAGAASLDFEKLGNANFQEMDFSGGAGSFDLDFRGTFEGECKISIDIGLGSADIIMPEGVPIQIETEGGGWLSSIDLHNDDLDEIDDDIFESDDFDRADTRIILELDVGLGSADVYWK